MRHPDHRFEWTRAEFAAWCERVCASPRLHRRAPRRRRRRPRASAPRPSWGCSAVREIAIPCPHGPGAARRRLRQRQVHLRRAPLPADRRWSPATSAAAWSPTTRTTRRPRPTRSTSCTTSSAPGCAAGCSPSSTPPTCRRTPAPSWSGSPRSHDVLVDAIVLDVPERVAIERNAARPDRTFGAHVVTRQHRDLRRSLRGMRREGSAASTCSTGDEIDTVTVVRERRGTTGATSPGRST